MSLLADALQPFVLRGMFDVTGRMGRVTIADTLIQPQAAYDLNFNNTAQTFTADFRDESPVALALAADACRLSCASFQTMVLTAAEMRERDSMAWSVIKLYYAAFYAGNAILRLLGESCSFFEPQHVLRINQLASAYGRVPTFSVNSGLYRCVVGGGGAAFTCEKLRAGNGGTHEAFWNVLGIKLEAVGATILQTPTLVMIEAQAVYSQLEQFRLLLKRRGNYSWLSSIRNEVQYRHEHKTWYPEQIKAQDRETLGRRVARWSQDPMGITFDSHSGPLGEFVSACCFIVALCQALLDRMSERSGARSFARVGPIAFIKDRSA